MARRPILDRLAGGFRRARRDDRVVRARVARRHLERRPYHGDCLRPGASDATTRTRVRMPRSRLSDSTRCKSRLISSCLGTVTRTHVSRPSQRVRSGGRRGPEAAWSLSLEDHLSVIARLEAETDLRRWRSTFADASSWRAGSRSTIETCAYPMFATMTPIVRKPVR
jgi:hypothetical protein